MGHLARIQRGQSAFSNALERMRVFKSWYKLVFPLNRFFKGRQLVRLRNGMEAWVRDVRSADLNIVRDVLGKGEYELEFLHLPSTTVVLDLGGNIGTFSMEVHRRFPSTRIIAYEPDAGNIEMFKLNAPYAEIVAKAVVAKTGTVQFEQGDNYVGLRVLTRGGVTVPAISLDDVVKDFLEVDLLKVDIEGSEYEALGHASPETFRKIRRIIMETHTVEGFDDAAWAETILAAHGFKTRWLDTAVIYGEK